MDHMICSIYIGYIYMISENTCVPNASVVIVKSMASKISFNDSWLFCVLDSKTDTKSKFKRFASAC